MFLSVASFGEALWDMLVEKEAEDSTIRETPPRKGVRKENVGEAEPSSSENQLQLR